MQPGQPLPSERRLAEVLGVSRPAVREAIKRLTEAGLVEVRHGDATTIRDFRKHAGLDLLPRLLIRSGEVDLVGRAQHPRDAAAQRAEDRRTRGTSIGRRSGGPARRVHRRPCGRARPGRTSASRPGLLGPRRRRRRFDRIPVDVQHTSRNLRACASGAGGHDGRRGGQARGLPPHRCGHPHGRPRRREGRGPRTTRTRRRWRCSPHSTAWRISDDDLSRDIDPPRRAPRVLVDRRCPRVLAPPVAVDDRRDVRRRVERQDRRRRLAGRRRPAPRSDARRIPVLRVDGSCLRVALAAKACRPDDGRFPAGPQAPRAPRRPA